MNKIAMLLLILTTVACGREEPSSLAGWDDRVRPIIVAFVADADNYGLTPGRLGRITAIQEVVDLSELGTCKASAKNERDWTATIELRASLFKDQDKLRKALYHELTHCLYGMGHFGQVGGIQYWAMTFTDKPWELQVKEHFKLLHDTVKEQYLKAN